MTGFKGFAGRRSAAGNSGLQERERRGETVELGKQQTGPDESDFDMNWKPYISLEEAITIFSDDPLLFEPGTYYRYTSYGVNMLQGVVETGSELGFEEYLRLRVWEPAGALRTSFDRPERIVPHRARGYLIDGSKVLNHPYEDVSYKFAGGGMLSTAEDLARIGAAFLEGRLMKPGTVRRMPDPQLDDGDKYFRGDDPPTPLRWRQALMWRIRKDEAGRDFVNHCGTVKGLAGHRTGRTTDQTARHPA